MQKSTTSTRNRFTRCAVGTKSAGSRACFQLRRNECTTCSLVSMNSLGCFRQAFAHNASHLLLWWQLYRKWQRKSISGISQKCGILVGAHGGKMTALSVTKSENHATKEEKGANAIPLGKALITRARASRMTRRIYPTRPALLIRRYGTLNYRAGGGEDQRRKPAQDLPMLSGAPILTKCWILAGYFVDASETKSARPAHYDAAEYQSNFEALVYADLRAW